MENDRIYKLIDNNNEILININQIIKISDTKLNQQEIEPFEIFGYYFFIELFHKKIEVYRQDKNELKIIKNKIISDFKKYPWIEIEKETYL